MIETSWKIAWIYPATFRNFKEMRIFKNLPKSSENVRKSSGNLLKTTYFCFYLIKHVRLLIYTHLSF